MDSELKKKSLQAHQVGNQTQEPKKNSNKSIEVSSRTAAKAIARTLFAAQGSLLFPRSKLRPLPIPSSQLLQLAKIFLLFKSRQLQLDENEQTRSLSCLTIPQHLGLSPAKKKNLRSPSPTQQTQSKDQSFFLPNGFQPPRETAVSLDPVYPTKDRPNRTKPRQLPTTQQHLERCSSKETNNVRIRPERDDRLLASIKNRTICIILIFDWAAALGQACPQEYQGRDVRSKTR